MKAEIVERIRLINKGQVPEGYKKSKVGIIPSDWEDYKLGKLLKLCERPIKMEDDKEYELVTVRRNYGGVDSRGLFFGKDILVKSQFLLKENDFLISKRQIAHGACGLVPKELENAIVSNEYNVFLPEDLIDIGFFNYYARLPFMKKNFYLMSDGVHIEKLLFKPQSWLKLKISIPSYKKQQKIASILSTWDKAIELKEKLISEKKKQKTALMQELLTGKKRLDGFDEEWEEVRLGDVLKLQGGYAFKSEYFEEEGIPIIRISNVSGTIEKIDGNIVYHNNINVSKEFLVEKNDVLIAMSGATTGKIGFYMANQVAHLNQRVGKFVIKKNEKLNNDFLKEIVVSDEFKNQLSKELTTGAQPNISSSQIESFIFNLPSIQEQTAIANILSLADKEISLLEKELEALKEQKKGLMQLLLTGVVRVN